MNTWEKPRFDELAMNAEIGAYQPDFGDDERSDEPWVTEAASGDAAATQVAPA